MLLCVNTLAGLADGAVRGEKLGSGKLQLPVPENLSNVLN